ncbi:MAG: hypothetical protein JXA99_13315 [Candidatus Lokiarchaeota archaeon]|nr:hypothetical protein [Candidatus Lokiarchaeota archaeon]
MSDKIRISIFDKRFIALLIPLIISLLYIIILIYLAIFQDEFGGFFGMKIPNEFITEFVFLIPGPMWTDIIVIYGIPIGIFCIIYYISPYTNRLFTKVHSIFYVFRKRPSYGIFQPSTKIFISKLLFRLILACLLTFILSYYIVQIGLGHLFRAGSAPDALFDAEAKFLATFFFLPFVLLLFFVLWSLEDSGMIAYRIFPEKRKNPDINGVYKIYKGFIEYLVGFSIIFVYVGLINATINHVQTESTIEALFIPFSLIFLPFIISGLIAIPLFLYEKNIDKMMNRIHPYLMKKGYNKINVPDFKDIEIR